MPNCDAFSAALVGDPEDPHEAELGLPPAGCHIKVFDTVSAGHAPDVHRAAALWLASSAAARDPSSFGTPVGGVWITHNFEVEHWHTYVAGGVRVHNKSGLMGRVANNLDNVFNRGGALLDGAGDILTAPIRAAGHLTTSIGSATSTLLSGLSKAGDEFRSGDIAGGFAVAGKAVADAVVEVGRGLKDAAQSVVFGIGDGLSKIGEGISKGVDRLVGGDSNDGTSNAKPLVLDLDHDGVEISVAGQVAFDMDADGFKELTNWVGPDDGFLVIDLSANGSRSGGDGKIDRTKELVLTEWFGLGEEATDLQALALFDQKRWGGNGDGILTSKDGVWRDLRVWRDADQDGIVDAGELRTLAFHKIIVLGLTPTLSGTTFTDPKDDVLLPGGSQILGKSHFTQSPGPITAYTVGVMADVSLAHDDRGFRTTTSGDVTTFTFEGGGTERLLELDGSWSSKVTLGAHNLDAVNGDGRANTLDGSTRKGAVTISGGAGNDTITGGPSGDLLSGDDGDDVVRGGSGDDVLLGGSGDDNIYGGAGDDTIVGQFNTDTMRGESGNDTITLYRDDKVRWNDGSPIDMGGTGYDKLILKTGTTFQSTFDTEDLSAFGFESFEGASGHDKVWGSDAAVNYKLDGGAGNDDLRGQKDADTLKGGPGDDVLYGRGGNDKLHGGPGADTFNFKRDYDNDRIYDFENVDKIRIEVEGIKTVSAALAKATASNGDVVFNFGYGDVLHVDDVTKGELENDLVIV